VLITVELNADDLRRAVVAYAGAPYAGKPYRLANVSLSDRIRPGDPAYRYAVVELESLALRGETDGPDAGGDGPRDDPWTFLPRPPGDSDDADDQDDGGGDDRRPYRG
jgi:hypothetical protein